MSRPPISRPVRLSSRSRALSEAYVVPSGFDMGTDHVLQHHGITVTFHDSVVAHLQERLIVWFNRLASACNQFRSFDYLLMGGAEGRIDSEVLEERRKRWLWEVRTQRAATVNLMMDLFKAGVEPLPADHLVDVGVASALRTDILLREAAIAAAGGQAAVQGFKDAAEVSINEALLRIYSEANEDAIRAAFQEEQSVWAKFEEDYERSLHAFWEEKERAAKEAAEAVRRVAKAAARAEKKAAKEAAEAKERALAEARQGPSAAAGRRRRDAKQRRSLVLDELRARMEKRQKSP